ncbi:hypothetical protein AVEN_194592-1 [Araneus ventricosus]|uniref:Uncharacterized protein n=1 Tax=Araneus ventricosus TaxID=182803 RepID=A0A4Y2A6T8_ARAVE|nr:hypothetical protein AVEN_194592-1 [Araneus ventricosus]
MHIFVNEPRTDAPKMINQHNTGSDHNKSTAKVLPFSVGEENVQVTRLSPGKKKYIEIRCLAELRFLCDEKTISDHFNSRILEDPPINRHRLLEAFDLLQIMKLKAS